MNPDLGTVERATESFGGFFVERALGTGRGRASFGVSGSTSSFDKLDKLELRDGTLITVANRFRDEAAPFDTESLTLKLRSNTMTVFGSLGVSDRLEIGGAVPLVSLRPPACRRVVRLRISPAAVRARRSRSRPLPEAPHLRVPPAESGGLPAREQTTSPRAGSEPSNV